MQEPSLQYPTTTIVPVVTGRQRQAEAVVEETLRGLDPLTDHIASTWWQLIRTPEHLFLGGMEDTKLPGAAENLYVAATEDIDAVKADLATAREKTTAILHKVNALRPEFPNANGDMRSHLKLLEKFSSNTEKSIAHAILARGIYHEKQLPRITPRVLPDRGDAFDPPFNKQGLLYIPGRYIVPGQRFNEMYGWDTAFVARGLMRNDRFNLAKNLVDSLLYEVEHYGTVLNGNRTYYYNSEKKPRSQPPLLATKILSVFKQYDKMENPVPANKYDWLEHAAAMAEKYHEHWVTPPHLHEASGLSKYDSRLGVPSFEVEHCEPGHYEQALTRLKAWHEESQTPLNKLTGEQRYFLERFYDARQEGLTPAFYAGDRAMRESGFDPSGRFGFHNADIASYLPVCLNSLRLREEEGIRDMYKELHDYDPHHHVWGAKIKQWDETAQRTRQAMQEWLWDDGKDHGQQQNRFPAFRDRFIRDDMRKQYDLPLFRDYNYVSMLFPLWVGLATPEQAESIVNHLYPKLQSRFGILTSDHKTGSQWDAPMIWAPLAVIASEALERYDYYYQALEVASGFLNMVKKDHEKTGKVYEKYEGMHGTSNTQRYVTNGYGLNAEGFAWTNAAVLELERAVMRLKKKILGQPLSPEQNEGDVTVKTEGHVRAAKENGPPPLWKLPTGKRLGPNGISANGTPSVSL